MTSRAIRYNPGFLDDEELVKLFVVRKHDLDFVLETLRDVKRPANAHILIVGPRGIGKTTLVRRIAAQVRTDPDLGRKWYPIIFSEESYEVGTPGEFWLAALFHLAGQTKDQRWLKAYGELKLESDEARLCDRALAQLMDFADEQQKRLILIVENLNMLLRDQLDDQDAWDLRHTLQNEPRVMLLGTATIRFEEIQNVDKAWFEIINIHELKPLDNNETQTLWKSFTGAQLALSQLRPVQILTGGSPRLISILAGFATKTSFRELMDNLVQLIDDHTEYFKGQLDSLAATERKVFVALLDLWDPSSAKVIAQTARLDVSKTSSYLNRLVSRGAVTVLRSGRKKLYQAAERMYNIYYLMRRRSQPSERVRAVVTFMVQFYQGDQLVTQAAKLAEEACHLEPARRLDHYNAYESIVSLSCEADRLRIVMTTPKEFFDIPDIPTSVRNLKQSHLDDAESWITLANVLRKDPSRTKEAEDAYKKAIELDPEEPRAWSGLGRLYEATKRYVEAEQTYERAIDLNPDSRAALSGLAWIEARNLMNYERAEMALRKLVELAPEEESYWIRLAELLYRHRGQDEEAKQAFQKAIEVSDEIFHPWLHYGDFLASHLKDYEAAEHAFRKTIEANPDCDRAWAHLGGVLHNVARYDESETALREALKLNPTNGWAWGELGHLLFSHLNRNIEAEQALRKAVEVDPEDSWAWQELANFLRDELQQFEEAEQAYKKVVELDRDEASAGWLNLIELYLKRIQKPEAAMKQAERFIERWAEDAKKLNNIAWLFYEAAPEKYLPTIENWARDAVVKGKNNWVPVHTLISILARESKWEEALILAPKVLDATAKSEKAIRPATDFIILAASSGFAKEALSMVIESKGSKALEPLAVGLRIFLGDSEFTAQEIFEVGQDVARRIRDLQIERSSENSGSAFKN
jgi:tetratricopeptide (TPR) repeat protein